jgi:hypothetical protein
MGWWSNGFWENGIMVYPAKDGIFDFPIFQHFILPCARQKF